MLEPDSLRSMARLTLMIGSAVALSACVSNDRGHSVSKSEAVETVEHFEFGDLTSSAWVSDGFDGTHQRQFIDDQLHFEVQQFAAEGGLDVGVSEVRFEAEPVSSAKTSLYVCSSYGTELTGPGRWWAGPKISVNWQGDESAKQNGDDWYENYIVEIASTPPEGLHEIFTGDYFKAEELAPFELAGSTYRNYKIRFHDWWQFWSVRQDYRASGIVPIEPIVDLWIAHGLPTNRSFDGVKANIETYGPIQGRGQLTLSYSDNPSDLSCD